MTQTLEVGTILRRKRKSAMTIAVNSWMEPGMLGVVIETDPKYGGYRVRMFSRPDKPTYVTHGDIYHYWEVVPKGEN